MLRHSRPKKWILAAVAVATGSLALTACGRNPGAQARSYPIPGIEALEAQADFARPKCITVSAADLMKKQTAVIQGKELFAAERAGIFRLERYELTQISDIMLGAPTPNFTVHVTDFDDLVSSAPRLSIESPCMDMKGIARELELSPVVEIESEQGLIQSSQPFQLQAIENGKLIASSRRPVPAPQPMPVGRIPSEAALLLGADYAERSQTRSFRVKEHDDGSLEVNAEFFSSDPGKPEARENTRMIIRVRAVYRWDAAA